MVYTLLKQRGGSSLDETGLVLALAQGDRAALEDTIRRYTHYVAAVAARGPGP